MAIKWPDTIKVGYKLYHVNTDLQEHEQWEEDIEGEAYGLTMSGDKVFSFRTKEVDEEIQRETILHELLHATFDIVHIQLDNDEEERIVGALSKCLFGIFKDNPGLAKVVFK